MNLAVLLTFIFCALSLLHFYWMMGGLWGFYAALPQKTDGSYLFIPSWKDSAVVAFGLTSFGLFYIILSGWIRFPFPEFVLKHCGWFIGGIFLLRAIGDFNYVGFFKKIKSTEFGRRDTWFYSPLCLAISVLCLWIQLR